VTLEPFRSGKRISRVSEVKSYRVSKPKRKFILFGSYTKRYEYILSNFHHRYLRHTALHMKFESADGTKGECRTNPLKIEVESMLDKESAADIKDIKPPVNFKGAWLKYLVIFLLPLVIAGRVQSLGEII